MLLSLHFHALDLDVGLRAQLFGDALRVGARLRDDALGLLLGIPQRLLVSLLGFLEALLGARAVLELFAHRLLAGRHQPAYRRNNVAPHQKHDECEPDQLPDDRQHCAIAPFSLRLPAQCRRAARGWPTSRPASPSRTSNRPRSSPTAA